jgi:hypothetical protein
VARKTATEMIADWLAKRPCSSPSLRGSTSGCEEKPSPENGLWSLERQRRCSSSSEPSWNAFGRSATIGAVDPYFVYLSVLGGIMGAAGFFFVWLERREAKSRRR